MNCQECKTELGKYKRKFCSRLCCTRNIQKRHRDTINANARKKLLENPEKERARRAENARKWRATHPDNARKFQRLKNKVGYIPTDDEVIFYGYKEPLRKFEGGYGYMGVISYSKDEDKIQCHMCGRLFKFLNNGHLGKCHNMTAGEYKQKVGLSPQASLVGEGTRLKLIDRGYNANHIQELKKAQEKRREIIKKTGKDPNHHPKMRLEKHNERGTCPDQLLDKIQKTIDSFGRVPTYEEFLAMHNGKFGGSIRKTFGGWTQALEKLGKKTYHAGHTREELLESLRNFYKVNGRTPRWSDMERGLTFNPYIYYKEFKSLNHARQEAGIPVLIPVGRRKIQEVMVDYK